MVRFKNRWLLLTLASEPIPIPDDYGHQITFANRAPNVTAHAITKALRTSLRVNFGDAASGAYAGPLMCKYYSPKSGIGIVRCARDGVRYVWGATTFLDSIDGHRVRICVRSCGGTIRKIQRKAISIDKFYILRLEQAKMHNISALRHAAAELEKPTDTMDVIEDDVGVPLDEDDDAASFDDNASLPCQESQDIPLSEECKTLLAKSQSDIMQVSH